jgi:NADH-quinone oxidoreductase subunit C
MTEQELLKNILDHFGEKVSGEVKRTKRVVLHTDIDNIEAVLLYCKEKLGYIHLVHFSCVDWIEDNQFELMYAIWHPEDKITIMTKVRIDRENPVAPNIDYMWMHAHTFEREIREMYGVQFPGLEAPKEFILEDWEEMPPMRRDFDTMKYSVETYFSRPGREDAKDVRETIRQRTGEELPDFAKKYSR